MSWRRTIGKALAVVVPALVLGALVWVVVARGAAPQSVRLADGTVFTLEAVTYAKEHQRYLVPIWTRLWYQFARRVLRKSTPKVSMGYSTTNETLGVWIRERLPPGQTARPGVRESPGRSWLADEGGKKRVLASHQISSSRPPSNNELLHLAVFHVIPRREKTFLFGDDLSDRDKIYLDGGFYSDRIEFRIANPALRSYPVWPAEPLPATRRDGDFIVTLTRLEARMVKYVPQFESRHFPSEACAELNFLAPAPALGAWWPVSVTLCDATGNMCESRIYSLTGSNNKWTTLFEYNLWPEESAWRMRVEFSRRDGYAPEDLWTINSVPVPLPQTLPSGSPLPPQTVHAETNLHGCRVRLRPLRWRSAGRGVPAAPASQPESFYSFAVEMTPAPVGIRCDFVGMTDDQGRPFRLTFPGHFAGLAEFEVQGPTNATSVNITLAVQKSRFVEFLVRPEVK